MSDPVIDTVIDTDVIRAYADRYKVPKITISRPAVARQYLLEIADCIDGLRTAIKIAATIKPSVVVDMHSPIKAALEVCEEAEKLKTRIKELESENERLKAKLENAGDDVMRIISSALAGSCERYVFHSESGRDFCRWGVVEQDIRGVFKGGE